MRRREFITLLGGGLLGRPFTVHAEQSGRPRTVGVLMNLDSDDAQVRARIAAFAQSLQELGWADGRGIQIAYRYGAGDPERIRKSALELLALSPDVVLAGGAISVAPLQQASRNVPIVFVDVTDPVGAGFAASLARPGGNATGFSNFEYGFSAKWLELLTEIAPGITRVAALRDSPLLPQWARWPRFSRLRPR